MSSQIAAKLPISCGRRAGRAMNHQCRCSPPSPQRQTWTRPISPIDRIARSIRAIRIPSSAASSSGRSPGSPRWTRGSSSSTTGRPVGSEKEWRRQRSLTQMNSLSGALQRQHSTPPAPRRGSSCATGGSRARGVSSPSNGNVSHVSTGGIRNESAARAYSSSGVSGTRRSMLTSTRASNRPARSPHVRSPHPAVAPRSRRVRIVLPDHRRLNGRPRPREGRSRHTGTRSSPSRRHGRVRLKPHPDHP